MCVKLLHGKLREVAERGALAHSAHLDAEDCRQFPPRKVKDGHLFISGCAQHSPLHSAPDARVVFLVKASGQMHIADAAVQFSVLGNA